MTTTKHLSGVTLKNDDSGEFEAVFSTFDVVDSDGDVVRKSAFDGSSKVIISAYNHASWGGGMLPVGKGEIVVEGDRAAVKGQFFTDTTHGLDTYRTVKQLSEDGQQEWSYSLRGIQSKMIDVDGQRVREITAMDPVTEVSPVIKGASVGTHTLSIKQDQKQSAGDIRDALNTAGRDRWGGDDVWTWLRDWDVDELTAVFSIDSGDGYRLVSVDFERDGSTVTLGDTETEVVAQTTYAPKGAKFSEHVKSVLAGVDALTARASEVVVLRAEKGKPLGAESTDLLERVTASLDDLKAVLTEHPTPQDEAAAVIEIARAHLNGAI